MEDQRAAIQDIIDAATSWNSADADRPDPLPEQWQAVVPLMKEAPTMALLLQAAAHALPDDDIRAEITQLLAKLGIEHPAAAPATALLRDCLGTIFSLQHQVGQMSSMFDDEDGTIQEACDDADETTERVRSYLAGQFTQAVDAAVGASCYRVGWEIDVHADTPEQAAERALLIQRTPDCTANVFTVTEGRNTSTVDFGDFPVYPIMRPA